MTPILDISNGLLKGDILSGELRNDAEKKELCVKYVLHMINRGHMNTALMKKTHLNFILSSAFITCNYLLLSLFDFRLRNLKTKKST